MNRPRGFVDRYDPTPVNCFPTAMQPKCGSCSRFRPGQQPGGKTVVIDPPAILGGAECPMWLRRAA